MASSSGGAQAAEQRTRLMQDVFTASQDSSPLIDYHAGIAITSTQTTPHTSNIRFASVRAKPDKDKSRDSLFPRLSSTASSPSASETRLSATRFPSTVSASTRFVKHRVPGVIVTPETAAAVRVKRRGGVFLSGSDAQPDDEAEDELTTPPLQPHLSGSHRSMTRIASAHGSLFTTRSEPKHRISWVGSTFQDFYDVVDEDDGQQYENYISDGLVGAVTESFSFRAFILLCIFCNTVLVGLFTVHSVQLHYQATLTALDKCFLTVFVVEILLKWYHGFWSFWKIGWNVFDFLLIFLSIAGDGLNFMSTGRILRIFRVIRAVRSLRSVSAVRGLQVVVTTIMRSLPDMANIIALLSLVMFIFSIVGMDVLGPKAPDRFGSMGEAFFSLFIMMTQDGWVDLWTEMQQNGLAVQAGVFCIVFIILAAFVFANLIVGVVVTGLLTTNREIMAQARNNDKELYAGMAIGGGGRKLGTREDAYIDRMDPVDWKYQKHIHRPGNIGSTISYEQLSNYFLVLTAIEDNIIEHERLIKAIGHALSRTQRCNNIEESAEDAGGAEAGAHEAEEEPDIGADAMTMMLHLRKPSSAESVTSKLVKPATGVDMQRQKWRAVRETVAHEVIEQQSHRRASMLPGGSPRRKTRIVIGAHPPMAGGHVPIVPSLPTIPDLSPGFTDGSISPGFQRPITPSLPQTISFPTAASPATTSQQAGPTLVVPISASAACSPPSPSASSSAPLDILPFSQPSVPLSSSSSSSSVSSSAASIALPSLPSLARADSLPSPAQPITSRSQPPPSSSSHRPAQRKSTIFFSRAPVVDPGTQPDGKQSNAWVSTPGPQQSPRMSRTRATPSQSHRRTSSANAVLAPISDAMPGEVPYLKEQALASRAEHDAAEARIRTGAGAGLLAPRQSGVFDIRGKRWAPRQSEVLESAPALAALASLSPVEEGARRVGGSRAISQEERERRKQRLRDRAREREEKSDEEEKRHLLAGSADSRAQDEEEDGESRDDVGSVPKTDAPHR